MIVAACAAILLTACGGSKGGRAVHANGTVNGHHVKDLYGTLPKSGTPTGGGTITMGQLNGDTPTYIFPIVPCGERDRRHRPARSTSSTCRSTTCRSAAQMKINCATSLAPSTRSSQTATGV